MPSIVGRKKERQALNEILLATKNGRGGLLLLSGEAGIGVTSLAETCLHQSRLRIWRGRARESATPAYSPLLQALRQYIRANDQAHTLFAGCGYLKEYLALLLPELGPAPEEGDRETLFEALRCALQTIAREEPTVIFLDDLQWADNATLELLAALASFAEEEALLLLAAFRSDDIPRGHPVRRLRDDLRRERRLRETEIGPLSEGETAVLLSQIIGQKTAPSLTNIIYSRTQGVPLFIEELAVALMENGRLQPDSEGLTLKPQDALPLPETLRDAILLRLDGLSTAAVHALEAAAVAGPRFSIDLVIELIQKEAGLNELFDHHLLIETEPGEAAFRHALMQEAVYDEIPWTRRRQLHRQTAVYLQSAGAPPAAIAEHWLAGKAEYEARHALIAACYTSCSLHAYRDAAFAGQRALSLWPDEGETAERLALLDQLGHCAQLSGMFSEAVRAWREAARMRQASGEMMEFAEVQRNLAGVLELQGTWDRALAARQEAAAAFSTAGVPAEAAVEILAMAGHLQSSGNYTTALDILAEAEKEIAQLDRPDLKARALGLKGVSRAKLGDIDQGREDVQAGLSLALTENLVTTAAEVYVRLATVAEHAADYQAAIETYETAYNFCEQNDQPGMASVCIGCLAGVLCRTGEWNRALTLCQEVDDWPGVSEGMQAVSAAVKGHIYLRKGLIPEAKRFLTECALIARRLEIASMTLETNGSLLLVAEHEGKIETAVRYGREMLADWESMEERHYVVSSLCSTATFFVGQKAQTEVNACAEALSQIASATGAPDALASLAYALGECALVDGDMDQASRQFAQAQELFAPLGLPYEHALAQWRAGVGAAAAGDRSSAVDYLFAAYRTARRLGAKPLADDTAHALLDLGEKVDERLGRRAAGRIKRAGLTRRQYEVLQLVAKGLTNQEIAGRLFLSTRTVDMHVSNILDRLDCRSRVDAVRKAGEIGLLS